MLLSGFTFIRNAIKYDFPIVECVESMLPLVDELVINVGRSEDGTEELVAKLAQSSPKIRVIHSVWDDLKTDRGLVLSEQTNIALAACQGRWCLYLQADEALLESEHAGIKAAIEREDSNPSDLIEGLRLRYLHFYGGYSLVQRPWNWYPSEIRVIRRGSGAQSHGDAQTFRVPSLSGERELKTRLIDAHVFHYGHARAPEVMKRKIHYFHRFWHGDRHGIEVQAAYKIDWKNLVWYWGVHPAPYRFRVEAGGAWSPKPAHLSLAQNDPIVIFADRKHDSLILDLKTCLQKHFVDVRVVYDLMSLLKVPKGSVLVDLLAEEHTLSKLAFLTLFFFTHFKRRIADAPSGKLKTLALKLYSFVNWGSHETKEQGFSVPNQEHANQLSHWLGVE